MASPARYTFDLDFQAPPKPAVAHVQMPEPPREPEVPMIDMVTHLIQLGEADERGRAAGRAEGQTSAEAQAAQRLADEAARIANACQRLLSTMDANHLQVEKDAINLAVSVARKLATRLIEREPIVEIRALLAECLGPLRKSPHLVLRINVADSEAIKSHVDKLVKESGFEGRMVILGEDDILRGDCRIEWAEGGIVHDLKHVMDDVEAAITRYIEARDVQIAKG